MIHWWLFDCSYVEYKFGQLISLIRHYDCGGDAWPWGMWAQTIQWPRFPLLIRGTLQIQIWFIRQRNNPTLEQTNKFWHPLIKIDTQARSILRLLITIASAIVATTYSWVLCFLRQFFKAVLSFCSAVYCSLKHFFCMYVPCMPHCAKGKSILVVADGIWLAFVLSNDNWDTCILGCPRHVYKNYTIPI